jgi:hypothetical protein
MKRAIFTVSSSVSFQLPRYMTEVILEDNIESLWSLDKTVILDDIRMLGTKASISPQVPEKGTARHSIPMETHIQVL